MPTPIDTMIDRAVMRCTKCDAPAGTCRCWTKCRCGWFYETGGTCRNPLHQIEQAAREMAESVSFAVLGEMRDKYPEPMRHASGGFRKTLKSVMEREVTDALVHWMMAAAEETKAGAQ